MRRKFWAGIVLTLLFVSLNTVAFGHPGRTDSNGGHYVRTPGWGYPVGSYHYHNGGSSSSYSSGGSSSASYNTSNINTRIATIPGYTVKLNNTWIDNQSRKYPILSYKNITYIPLTYNVCSALGISPNWSSVNGLSLTRGIKSSYTEPLIEYDIFAYNYPGKNISVTLPGNMTVNGTWFANAQQEYPFIEYRDITYMPLTWNNAYNQFGLTITWDDTNGLSVSK